MSDQTTETYGTVDLYLGAFLRAKGIKLVDVDKSGRRVTFLFENGDETHKLIKEFFGDGVVSVNSFQHAIKDLKSITYNIA